MLSILIPIYNYKVHTLVSTLHKQASIEQIPFEIICIDDASTQFNAENDRLAELNNVQYQKLETNIGRSALRNLLARKAQYPSLLFIDTDMDIKNDAYIKTYLTYAESYDVVYGGILYEETPPNKDYMLRWKYGTKREALLPLQRNQDPYFSIKTCNVLIKKNVFNSIQFNENIREYGHEDTLFSIDVSRKKLKILHIENPLYHLGIESSQQYLNKVEIACKSLTFIADHYLEEEEKNHIRLLYFYNRIKKMGLLWFVKNIYLLFNKSILKNLLSENPSLLLLDYYKLMSFEKNQKK